MNKIIVGNIKKHMKRKKMNQSMLASVAGITDANMSQLLLLRHGMTLTVAVKICKALGISLNVLIKK